MTPGVVGNCPPTPSAGTLPTTPGSGYYPPSPSTGTTPTTPGGGYYPPSPSTGTDPNTPAGGGCPPAPSTGTDPNTPGGGYSTPPTPCIGTTPPACTPTTPDVPISTPSTPPFSPLVPTPPTNTPAPFDPNTPPFSTGPYSYWMSHPGVIWGLFGFWCPLVRLFGPSAAVPFGHDLTVPEALANTRADGVGALYREGTASLLNSMVSAGGFPFTTQQVKDGFGAALGSGDERAAAAQAQLFKMANEGQAKH